MMHDAERKRSSPSDEEMWWLLIRRDANKKGSQGPRACGKKERLGLISSPSHRSTQRMVLMPARGASLGPGVPEARRISRVVEAACLHNRRNVIYGSTDGAELEFEAGGAACGDASRW
jgi:hypothetical protein